MKRIRATLKLHRYLRQRLPIVLVARDARPLLVWTQALEANVAPGLIDVETHYYVMSTSVQSRSLSSSGFLELLARLHDASSNGYENFPEGALREDHFLVNGCDASLSADNATAALASPVASLHAVRQYSTLFLLFIEELPGRSETRIRRRIL